MEKEDKPKEESKEEPKEDLKVTSSNPFDAPSEEEEEAGNPFDPEEVKVTSPNPFDNPSEEEEEESGNPFAAPEEKPKEEEKSEEKPKEEKPEEKKSEEESSDSEGVSDLHHGPIKHRFALNTFMKSASKSLSSILNKEEDGDDESIHYEFVISRS